MKYTHPSLLTLLLAATSVGVSVTSAQSSRPVVLTPPAVQNGSNWSRAPLPAARPFDDVKAPDGKAIDDELSPDANLEPAVPPARVAILQGAGTPAYAATTTTTTSEPALTPTGRATVVVPAPAVGSSQRPVTMTPPAIQDGSNWSRAPLPAKRPFDDVKGPDGQAIDPLPEVPPTPSTPGH